jgi:hypothetical protein
VIGLFPCGVRLGFFIYGVGVERMSRQGGGDKKSFACTLVYVFICSCGLSWFKASIFPLKLRAKTVFFCCFLLVSIE